MSVSSTEQGLLTPQNCAVIFIDHQPQMFDGAAALEPTLFNKVMVLASAAKIFEVPVILTCCESANLGGPISRYLTDLFPDCIPIERSSMNAWDDQAFVAAVHQTARKNFLVAALWSETSLVFPALQMVDEGYCIYAVVDACSGTSVLAHDAAIRRMEQAGVVSMTALQVLLEFQRDWARQEHREEVVTVLKEYGGFDYGARYAQDTHPRSLGRS
jgi:nicotinamidase-related amidase